ncbi:hypothetical protein ACFOKI_09170 [Sphingomonas qilianensis]|uniref:Uncharacterized protein n=1 Tax=Sphingomonas qilianensis TaxID=1736690 RepID=A0ABU9XSL5_9SPHN
MTLTLADLCASPDHYLHSLDGETAVFVPMDRAAYHRSIFLDARIMPAAEGSMRVPVAAFDGVDMPIQPTAWIFHVAHCGSTLLARALDQLSGNLVLREPLALRQCAISADAARLPIVTAMLGKRYQSDLLTIVKANVPVNFLLPELAVMAPHAPAIFLHLGLRDYLSAILRSDNHRAWLRRVTTLLASHLGDMTGWPDADRAAALWLAQTERFAVALEQMPQARSLDAEIFFTAPAPVLAATARLFRMPLDDADSDAIAGGALFTRYSKDPTVQFDNNARLARRATIETALADELAAAQRWIERQPGATPAAAILAGAALIN